MIQPQWSASKAKRVLAAAERSGLSLEAFAREQGVTPQRLYWWRKRLREQREAATENKTTALVPTRPAMSFVELAVEPEQRASIEIVLGNGRIVRVPPAFDDDTLSRVLAIVDGAT
jgi:transposase-like protein